MSNDVFQFVCQFNGFLFVEVTEESDITAFGDIKRAMEKVYNSRNNNFDKLDALHCVTPFFRHECFSNWRHNVTNCPGVMIPNLTLKHHAVHWNESSNPLIESKRKRLHDMSLIFGRNGPRIN